MQAVGISGAIVTVIIFIASRYGIEIPPEVAAAMALLFSWIAGYMTPEAMQKLVEVGAKAVKDADESAR